jgi:hypothetical protein
MMMKTSPREDAGVEADTSEIEPVTGQPIEEAEKNLSRHATKDSNPPVDEQWRTSVMAAGGAGQTRDEQGTNQNKVDNDGDKD